MDRAREVLLRAPTAEDYRALAAIDPAQRTPLDHARLAEAAWWLAKFEESMAERQAAYTGFVEAGDDRIAGLLAARLSIEFALHGEPAVGAGFLARARRHLRDQPDCVERGFLSMVEASTLRMEQRPDEALECVSEAIACAERFADHDLLAMALHIEGLLLLDGGRVADGLARMDEAMALLLAGEVSPYFTGIVFCALIHACLELSDIRRAGDWSDAAGIWCESLPPEAPIIGFCRVNRAEVDRIRGSWAEAEAAAALAVEQLTAIDPGIGRPRALSDRRDPPANGRSGGRRGCVRPCARVGSRPPAGARAAAVGAGRPRRRRGGAPNCDRNAVHCTRPRAHLGRHRRGGACGGRRGRGANGGR